MAVSPRKVSKSKLSMYLRTKCDLELYLSLHTESALHNAGLPDPLKARPGIGILQRAGRDFEAAKNDDLRAAFGSAVIQNGHGGLNTDDLYAALLSVRSVPSIILQAKFRPEDFRNQALANLGLSPSLFAVIPPFDALIPDIIVVRNAELGEEEVLPSGDRQSILTTDNRLALDVIDIKHASEPNASYSAEVALYTFMLSNFIRHAGLDSQFFVSSQTYLWTRSADRNSALQQITTHSPTAPILHKLAALYEDCDQVPYQFYIQTIRRFFREDLPRVISIGDQNWHNLEWHVDSRCSSCDWLGYRRWLSPQDQQKVNANPHHYCASRAQVVDHLSRLPGITRGARHTLARNGLSTTADVALTTGAEPAYRQHTVLKKDRQRLPTKASALQTGNVSVDHQALIATLARNANLQINVSVNFDPSSGLLTGLALNGRIIFPYRQSGTVQPHRLQGNSFVVDGKSIQQEWVALEAFLQQLEAYTTVAEQQFIRNGFTTPAGTAARITSQIAFWEKRQFEELCAALGRHLPRVLALTSRRARALAWLFPPEELLERDDGAISPCVVFVEDIIKRVLSGPLVHALTLFDVADCYHYGQTPPWAPDAYYREYLSNGVPRERIYEIWSGADPVRRGAQIIPRANLLSYFLNALQAQVRALDSVVLRLRTDFQGRLRGRASTLSLSIPQGSRGVSFDGKLWVWWDTLDNATSGQEAHIRLAEPALSLEANYEAVRLIQQIAVLPNGDRLYDVSPESIDAKLEEGDSYLAVGLDNIPGFPLTSLNQHIPLGTVYGGNPANLNKPLYSTLRATLVSFDRNNLRAVVRYGECEPGFINFMNNQAGISLTAGVFLLEGKSGYDPAAITRGILQEIGNPPIATPDPVAAQAMAAPLGQPGTDPAIPAAHVLWNAPTLQSQTALPGTVASALAQAAATTHLLNASQTDAVRDGLHQRLTVIWGPPGTGKTKTLVALLHTIIRHANQLGQARRILISGPTYKAVNEVIDRLLEFTATDPQADFTLYFGCSSSRDPIPLRPLAAHQRAFSFHLSNSDTHWNSCLQDLSNPPRPIVFATTVHQAHRAAQALTGNKTADLFDLVILDESSQIPVTRALGAIGSIAAEGQLIVAGDHLQMPPIFALEPPAGAEYLIGSIQTYLLSRNFGSSLHISTLLENFRSSAELVEFARTIGYPQSLHSAHQHTRLNLLSPISALQSSLPSHLPWSAAWIDLLDPSRGAMTLLHDDAISSQSNEYEARIVAALAYCLRQSVSRHLDGRPGSPQHQPPTAADFWRECIGIVTPHKAQRAAIVRELRALFPNDAPADIAGAVDTVEKFQGGQRHTIIVSFGVGDPDVIAGEEAFLMQLERTNVAISRAMAKCIVIMPRSLAGHVPEDKKALETAHALKGYVDEFCNTAGDIQIGTGSDARSGQIRWHV